MIPLIRRMRSRNKRLRIVTKLPPCALRDEVFHIPEILGLILFFCLPKLERRYNDRFPRINPTAVLLSQVCRYWRSVAISTPCLWSEIRVYKGSAEEFSENFARWQVQTLKEHLRRSENCSVSLDVLMDVMDLSERTPSVVAYMRDVLELVNSCSSRWKALSIAAPVDFLPPIFKTLELGAPVLLRALDLHMPYQYDPIAFTGDRGQCNLDLQWAVSLTSFKIYGHLELPHIRLTSLPSGLKSLKIDFLDLNYVDYKHLSSNPTEVRVLSVEGHLTKVFFAALPAIFPVVEHLSISTTFGLDRDLLSSPEVENNHPTLKSLHLTASSSALAEKITCSSLEHLSIGFDPDRFPDDFDSYGSIISSFLRRSRIQLVKLEILCGLYGDCADVNETELISVLREQASLRCFKTINHRLSDSLLTALTIPRYYARSHNSNTSEGSPTSAEDGREGPRTGDGPLVCPFLQEINIETRNPTSFSSKCIIDVILSRRTHFSSSFGRADVTSAGSDEIHQTQITPSTPRTSGNLLHKFYLHYCCPTVHHQKVETILNEVKNVPAIKSCKKDGYYVSLSVSAGMWGRLRGTIGNN